jgi:hypothetical protein
MDEQRAARQVAALDQGEEPTASGVQPGERIIIAHVEGSAVLPPSFRRDGTRDTHVSVRATGTPVQRAASAGATRTTQRHPVPAHSPSFDLGQRQRSFGAHAMFSRT